MGAIFFFGFRNLWHHLLSAKRCLLSHPLPSFSLSWMILTFYYCFLDTMVLKWDTEESHSNMVSFFWFYFFSKTELLNSLTSEMQLLSEGQLPSFPLTPVLCMVFVFQCQVIILSISSSTFKFLSVWWHGLGFYFFFSWMEKTFSPCLPTLGCVLLPLGSHTKRFCCCYCHVLPMLWFSSSRAVCVALHWRQLHW